MEIFLQNGHVVKNFSFQKRNVFNDGGLKGDCTDVTQVECYA